MIATRTLSSLRGLWPLVAAMTSFLRPPPNGTDRRRFDWKGTPSRSLSASRITSLVLLARSNASSWIRRFSAGGSRSRTAAAGAREGDAEPVGEDSDRDVVEVARLRLDLVDETALELRRHADEDACAGIASSQLPISIAIALPRVYRPTAVLLEAALNEDRGDPDARRNGGAESVPGLVRQSR